MMLLGLLFELKDINLHKDSPHKLVIPAMKSKLGITLSLLQSRVASCRCGAFASSKFKTV